MPHGLSQYVSTALPSELMTTDSVPMEAVAVTSTEGEVLHLVDRVNIREFLRILGICFFFIELYFEQLCNFAGVCH